MDTSHRNKEAKEICILFFNLSVRDRERSLPDVRAGHQTFHRRAGCSVKRTRTKVRIGEVGG